MKEFVCIVCPNGCHLSIDENTLEVSGNKCLRGAEFAKKELVAPVRSLCTTVRTVFEDWPVGPVKTTKDIPLDKVFEVMAEIKKMVVKTRLKHGDLIISNVCGLDSSIVVTSDRLVEDR